MRVLVVYASQFGSTRDIAERIASVLRRAGPEVALAAARESPDPAAFDAVVVGSSVHGRHWVEEGASFLANNADTLATRPVWLFSSGPVGDRAVRSPQPDPQEVEVVWQRIRPRGHHVFAGSFDRATADFSGFRLLERTLVRRLLPDGDWRDWDAIDRWAQGIAASLQGVALARGAR